MTEPLHDSNLKPVICLEGRHLAYADGTQTVSYDLGKIVKVYLHSGRFFHPDFYELQFEGSEAFISSESEGSNALYKYLLSLENADLDAAKRFIRCTDAETFLLWTRPQS